MREPIELAKMLALTAGFLGIFLLYLLLVSMPTIIVYIFYVRGGL